MDDMEINIVTSRFEHHADHSGYDQIVRFLQDFLKVSVLNVSNSVAPYIPWPIVKLLVNRSGLYDLGYRVRSFYTEEIVAKNILSRKNEIYHFIYGENNYRYSGMFNNCRGNKIIASFHFPPSLLRKEIPNTRHIKKLSAVIALGRSQYSYFASLIGEKKVYFVPHGVDAGYFCPSSSQRHNKACLCTGMHLRDYPLLSKAIKFVYKKDKDIKFVVVSDKESIRYFADMPSVQYLSGISEEQLLQLYQRSTLFVMPLVDCAANNALLEAMASGLPILTTSIGDIKDYADESCAVFVEPGNAEAFAKNILELLGDDKRLMGMSVHARKKALDFDWNNVALQMASVYQKILQE